MAAAVNALRRPATAPRTDLQQASSWLRQAEIDLKAMSMAFYSKGHAAGNVFDPLHTLSLAAEVVDRALKSAMLRLRGLTQEEFVGHHFSVLHRRLQHAAVKHMKQDLPGDVCDMEWLKGIYLATHVAHHPVPQHAGAASHQRNGPCRFYSIKDTQRAGVLADEIFHWVKALSEILDSLDQTHQKPKHWEELEDDQSCHSYGSGSDSYDFEDDLPESPKSGKNRLHLERTALEHLEPSEEAEDAVFEEVPSPKNNAFLSGTTKDTQDSLETVLQYMHMARRLRAKGLMPRAIRMMERALMIANRFGQEHPALALETCKVRLNFAAYLSEGFRNREALKAIKETQESLDRLVQWASKCSGEELAAQALGGEARSLHCCALVAEAMAVALFEEDGKPPPEEISEELKEMARKTISSMPADHPLPSLVRRALGTVRATSPKILRSLGKLPKKSASNLLLVPSKVNKGEGPFAAPAELGTDAEAPVTAPTTPETPASMQLKYMVDAFSRHKRGAEEQDVFKQYLRDLELARVAHLLSLSDDWEMQARKKLENSRRKARFEMELVDVDELKEKRYTQQGHKVFMQQMRKMNKSASDPSIRRAARRDKTAPEIFQLKKLSRKMKPSVKPPQPPPTPPHKLKVDQELAGNMKMLRGDHDKIQKF